MRNTRTFQDEEGEEEEVYIATAIQAVQALPINLRSAQLMQSAGRAAQARRKSSTSNTTRTTTTKTAQPSQQASSTAPAKFRWKLTFLFAKRLFFSRLFFIFFIFIFCFSSGKKLKISKWGAWGNWLRNSLGGGRNKSEHTKNQVRKRRYLSFIMIKNKNKNKNPHFHLNPQKSRKKDKLFPDWITSNPNPDRKSVV